MLFFRLFEDTDLSHDGFIYKSVAVIIHAFLQRHIHCVVFASSVSDVIQSSCAGEEVAILVEADCHHSISLQKGFFHPITVMDVNVHVQHPAGI